MKISSKLIANVLIAIVGLSLVAACGKKKDDSQAAVSEARGGRGSTTGAGDSLLPSGQPYNPGPGAAVYADDQYAAAFNQSIKVLVSATMNPEDVGTVDHKNGAILQGEVSFDRATGRMNPASSKIQLTITDDKTDAEGNLYEPIVIKVMGSSGTVANGQVNLIFSDSYGSISLIGTYNSTTFDGHLDFKNNKSYNGLTGGTLGRFSMPVCNFFNCQ